MKSLLLSEIFPPKVGGSGRWFWEVYRRLPRDRFAIAAGDAPGAAAVDEASDLDIHRLPLTFSTRLLRRSSLGEYRAAYAQVAKLRRDLGIEVVHCGRSIPEGLLGLWGKWCSRTPYLVFCHGEEVNLSNSERRPPWHARRVYGSRELGLIVGRVLAGARLLIANSENTRSILVERWGLPAARVVRLNPGVETERFVPAAPDDEQRRRFGWGERPVVLTVGRLQERKGHDILIEAVPEIKARVPNVLYSIVGLGEEEARLRGLVSRLGLEEHVQFLGGAPDDDLVAAYQQCDLFVLPNRQIEGDIEGFGIVLLEAQSCARPVIAGASGGTAETMQIPETGLVVPCDEPGELAAAVTELLVDDERRQRMGRAARDWVTSRFDWEVLSAQAGELFADLGGRAGR